MKKMLCVSAMLLAFCLTACAGKPSANSGETNFNSGAKVEEHLENLESIQQRISDIADKNNSEAPSEAAETTVSQDTEKPYDAVISDYVVTDNVLNDLSEMEFALDRVLYRLPFSYSELLNFGWTGELSSDQLLEPQDEVWLYATNGEITIAVGVYNTDPTEALPMTDCSVIGIEVNAEDLDGMEFAIAKGISLSSAWQEVAEAFGEDEYAADRDADDTAVDFLYQPSTQFSVEMSFDNEFPEDNAISLYLDLDQ